MIFMTRDLDGLMWINMVSAKRASACYPDRVVGLPHGVDAGFLG